MYHKMHASCELQRSQVPSSLRLLGVGKRVAYNILKQLIQLTTVHATLLLSHYSKVMASSSTAFKTFSLENNILQVSPQDEIFKYDVEANKVILREQPWRNESVSVYMLDCYTGLTIC